MDGSALAWVVQLGCSLSVIHEPLNQTPTNCASDFPRFEQPDEINELWREPSPKSPPSARVSVTNRSTMPSRLPIGSSRPSTRRACPCKQTTHRSDGRCPFARCHFACCCFLYGCHSRWGLLCPTRIADRAHAIRVATKVKLLLPQLITTIVASQQTASKPL